MVKYVMLLIVLSLSFAALTLYKEPIKETTVQNVIPTPRVKPSGTVVKKNFGKEATESATTQSISPVYQTFNNCGPASLSMIMAYNGIVKSQEELADILRPYRNPQGDNDDKSISSEEYIQTSRSFGLYTVNRPNGSVELIKRLLSNNIPVVVKTWLNPGEDIGHFRIVTGYNDKERQFNQVDSYQGLKNIDYDIFVEMWQPFNYEYMIVIKPENQSVVETILSEQINEKTAWQDALVRAINEQAASSNNPYPLFNQAVAHFHLGDYDKAIELFEQVEKGLPPRMLWYQIAPIEAYEKVGNHDRVIALTDRILNNHNRAYSELYLLRGKSYLKINQPDLAKQEFEKALFYNKNYQAAQDALESL